MPKIVICDLDLTIAWNEERIIWRKNGSIDFKQLMAGIVDDPPYPYAAGVLDFLHDHGYMIVFLTGRGEYNHLETITWLNRHGFWYADSILYMKSEAQEKSRVPDHVFKHHSLKEIRQLGTVALAFEDNQRTVAMYEQNGIPVIQIRHTDDWFYIAKWIELIVK
jgi:hypothetical protein